MSFCPFGSSPTLISSRLPDCDLSGLESLTLVWIRLLCADPFDPMSNLSCESLLGENRDVELNPLPFVVLTSVVKLDI